MNPRRDFFRQLFVGAAALPVVVKAIVSEPAVSPLPAPLVDFKNVRYGDPRMWTNNPAWDKATHRIYFAQQYKGDIEWCYIKDNGITWSLDQKPLRFTA